MIKARGRKISRELKRSNFQILLCVFIFDVFYINEIHSLFFSSFYIINLNWSIQNQYDIIMMLIFSDKNCIQGVENLKLWEAEYLVFSMK